MWYAAHVIVWIKKKSNPDHACRFWENVILIEASDPDVASKKAEERGRLGAGPDPSLTVNGEPGELVFMGVRKLIEISSPDAKDQPVDEAEITYSEMEVRDHADLVKIANGDEVPVTYIE